MKPNSSRSILTKLTPKAHRAVALRDAGLALLRSTPAEGGQPVLDWSKFGICISHHTPFQGLPPVPEGMKYVAALMGRRTDLTYGLDVWCGSKVLNITWNAGDDFEIATFRRGSWESVVLDCAAHPTPADINYSAIPS